MNQELALLLASFPINIASSAVYDFLKSCFAGNTNLTEPELKRKLATFLDIQNADIYADKIIKLLATTGDIRIEGSNLYASSVMMASAPGTQFVFGNNSESRTKSGSLISAGRGASITGSGGARVEQDENGNIILQAG